MCLLSASSMAQLTVGGTVFDQTKVVPVKDVIVKSSCGEIAITDSLGRYKITVDKNDSLVFNYRNKNTEKFSVNQIRDYDDFNVSLQIKVAEKFRTLKEVRVYSKTYAQDSIENRSTYAKIFIYEKPSISTSTSAYSGAAGLDLDEFINMFRFRRNRQLAVMQKRLISEEEERYINYRFNKTLVRRITGLTGKDLDKFLLVYRPSYEFSLQSSTPEFYQYILNCSYQYKKLLPVQ
jgi:hypothetical protein